MKRRMVRGKVHGKARGIVTADGHYRERLLQSLALGKIRTGDIDEAVLGGIYMPGLFGFFAPYAGDLGALIAEGLVKWWIEDNGDVWYELTAVTQ